MKDTFLETVLAKTRGRVGLAKECRRLSEIRSQAKAIRSGKMAHRFRSALLRKDRFNIIAEVKRASPSRGILNAEIDISSLARSYEFGGAAAVSVLTESEYFGGSLKDLMTVAEAVEIPVLRKDFIVDEYQIYEAAESGADAVLLIVAALTKIDLSSFLLITENELGMDAIVEVHTLAELEIAISAGATIIGVNNRDLGTLNVSLDVSRRLIGSSREGKIMVSESGLTCRSDVEELAGLGFDAFLVGEMLMRSNEIEKDLKILSDKPRTV